MKLTIGGKDYELVLGLRALNYLDMVYQVNGMNLGYGVQSVTMAINGDSITGIVHLIKAGTITETSKPSDKDIEEYIGSLKEKELEKLFRDFLSLLRSQNLTKITAKNTLDTMERNIAEAQAKL